MAYNPPLMSGPIAPESNPPINPQYFQPSRFQIIGLSFGLSTLVTTAEDHNYVIGQLVRLLIPQPNGSRQLNERVGYVVAIPAANQVTVNINSVGTEDFISSISSSQNIPQIVSVGDINTGSVNVGRTNNGLSPAGSFINISPN